MVHSDRAYTAEEMAQMDAEDRVRDDTSDGIDWDEIIATTEPDVQAGVGYTLEEVEQHIDGVIGRARVRRRTDAR